MEQKASRPIIVRYGDFVYDVTAFAGLHPGGRRVLEMVNGMDVQLFMNGEVSLSGVQHAHSEIAYRMLRKYAMVNPEEEEKNSGIDISRPVYDQVGMLQDYYWAWIHQPICQPLRLFYSDRLEALTRTKWYYIPSIWLPLAIYLAVIGWNDLRQQYDPTSYSTSCHFVIVFAMGVTWWSLLEYNVHRYGFHWRPPADSPRLILMHFLLHGLHHKTPMDKERLVFPPAAASIVVILLFAVYRTLMSWTNCVIFSSGNLLGYVCYDMMHYYLHHGEPLPDSYLHELKKYHHNHHYNNHDHAYGISSPLWDKLFGTEGSYD